MWSHQLIYRQNREVTPGSSGNMIKINCNDPVAMASEWFII
ncbi:MAG: hypothetical protein ACI9FJ_003154, partial [Alteromonadaceae bacterium]